MAVTEGKAASDVRRHIANRDGYPRKIKSTLSAKAVVDGYVKHTLIFRLGNV